jgi:hypothetical protein
MCRPNVKMQIGVGAGVATHPVAFLAPRSVEVMRELAARLDEVRLQNGIGTGQEHLASFTWPTRRTGVTRLRDGLLPYRKPLHHLLTDFVSDTRHFGQGDGASGCHLNFRLDYVLVPISPAGGNIPGEHEARE